MRKAKITEANVQQALAEYALWRYGENTVRSLRGRCTYNLDFGDNEHEFKQLLTWFILEWKDPVTGRTVLEDFVANVHQLDADLARKVLGMRNLVADTFLIRERNGNILSVESSDSRKFAVWVVPENAAIYVPGRRVDGRIYPWGDFYRFAGITRLIKSDEDIFRETGVIMPGMVDRLTSMMLKGDMEEVILRRNATAASVLNKFPPWMVDEICQTLNIRTRGKKNQKVKDIAAILDSPRVTDIVKSLPEEARDALDTVRRNGGVIGYGK